uniref:Uncharacterized protein n=1 Tax=Hordeum vulgare subsp. vulgare TaxID=112509 RepID=A0A8I7BK57_HORVV
MTIRRRTMLITLLVVLLAFSGPIKGEDQLGRGDGGDLAPPSDPGSSHLAPPPPPPYRKINAPPPPKTDLPPPPPPPPKTDLTQPPSGSCVEVKLYRGPCINMLCAGACIAQLHQGGHCRGSIFTGGCYCFVCSITKSSPALH